MDNSTRRQLLDRARASGFPGSILDVYSAYGQGRDLIQEFVQEQQAASFQPPMQVAQTPEEQEQGLRPAHEAGNVDQSMAFPNVQPGQSFNTMGMKVPINIDKVDNNGNLVESFKAVPPGIQNLPTGPYEGTVIESPARMQKGGFHQKIYTDKEEFAKANQAYNDSLFWYNQGEKDYDLYLKMSAERPDIRTHNWNNPIKDDEYIQPIQGYGFIMTQDQWDKTHYPDRVFRYKKPTTLPVYQPEPEVKPITSKSGTLPLDNDKGLMPSKKLQMQEGIVPVRETYYQQFDPSHPDAGKIKTYYDPVKKEYVKEPPFELKKTGGSYQTNQEISMYEWRTGRPEESRKRYIVGGLKNRVLYNKAKYKR